MTVPSPPSEPPLPERIQANVFRQVSAEHGYSAFVFIRSRGQEAACRTLVQLLLDDGLTRSDAEARRSKPPLVAGVGMTAVALRDLYGLEIEPLPLTASKVLNPDGLRTEPALEDPYTVGMSARRAELDDLETDWPGQDHGLMLWLAASDAAAVGQFLERPDISRLAPVVEVGAQGNGPRKLLGWEDGISQPYIEALGPADPATRSRKLRGGGTPTPDGWQPVPAGEFVLGEPDAGNATEAPGPDWLTRGGTFVVYRKYRLNAATLERQLDQQQSAADAQRGEPLPFSSEDLAAKLMGRYRTSANPGRASDDAAIANSPGVVGPDGHNSMVAASFNDFVYAEDTTGSVCPLGAHIRRANPRDALGFDGQLAERHRIIRRGVPFEDELGPGLHFVAVNARIADQFEFIQQQWLNTGHTFRVGSDIDPFVGARTGGPVRFVIQGDRPAVVTLAEPISELIGGDYFLMPGLDGLRTLVGQVGERS